MFENIKHKKKINLIENIFYLLIRIIIRECIGKRGKNKIDTKSIEDFQLRKGPNWDLSDWQSDLFRNVIRIKLCRCENVCLFQYIVHAFGVYSSIRNQLEK